MTRFYTVLGISGIFDIYDSRNEEGKDAKDRCENATNQEPKLNANSIGDWSRDGQANGGYGVYQGATD